MNKHLNWLPIIHILEAIKKLNFSKSDFKNPNWIRSIRIQIKGANADP